MAKPRRFVRMFKAQFVPKVESGEKRQTVRPRPERMPQAGDVIDCREWMGKPYRSRQRKLREGRITRVDEIFIVAMRLPECPDICIGERWLNPEEMEAFAKADGFESTAGMGRWFHVEHGLPFKGIVIYWEAGGLNGREGREGRDGRDGRDGQSWKGGNDGAA